MKRQIIAIDVDDVIADSTEVTRLVVNKNLGIDLQVEHYRVPGDFNNYYEDVWRAHGLS